MYNLHNGKYFYFYERDTEKMKRKIISRILCLILTLAALVASATLVASANGEYKVVFAVPEEVDAIGTETVVSGESVDLPTALNSFTRDGKEYTFVGWSEDEVENSSVKPAIIEGSTYTPEKTTTLYAIYQNAITTSADPEYIKVTDAGSLAAGDKVVIVAATANYAMSTQNSNNRKAVAVTKSGNKVTWTTAVTVFTLEEGSSSGTFSFKDGSNYLYSTLNSNNYLRSQTTKNAAASWTITISSTGVATVKAGTGTDRKSVV